MLSIDDIQQRIPHRAPFLWLDEVVELTDQRIVARKFIDPELDVFTGHYPGFPVLPGVLLCEAAFQAGAVLVSQLMQAESGKVPVVTRLNNTQFRRPVRPGETIDIEVDLTEQLAQAFFMKGKVSVASQVAARLEYAVSSATL